jgi:hypothetical protein
MNNMATQACNAALLSEFKKFATSAASMISVAMHPSTPKAMYCGRGKRSTKNMPRTLVPVANVSQAAGYKSCLTGEKPSWL